MKLQVPLCLTNPCNSSHREWAWAKHDTGILSQGESLQGKRKRKRSLPMKPVTLLLLSWCFWNKSLGIIIEMKALKWNIVTGRVPTGISINCDFFFWPNVLFLTGRGILTQSTLPTRKGQVLSPPSLMTLIWSWCAWTLFGDLGVREPYLFSWMF